MVTTIQVAAALDGFGVCEEVDIHADRGHVSHCVERGVACAALAVVTPTRWDGARDECVEVRRGWFPVAYWNRGEVRVGAYQGGRWVASGGIWIPDAACSDRVRERGTDRFRFIVELVREAMDAVLGVAQPRLA